MFVKLKKAGKELFIMEITNEKIELNGLIHKGVDKILILMAILSIVYGIAFTLLEKLSVARKISAFLPVWFS